MAKKKGLSRQFAKDVKSEKKLEPSEYKIVPQKIPRIELDDPTEELRKHKELFEVQEKKPVKVPKPSKSVKPEVPNKDKIKLIANKLNFIKKSKAEREKMEEKEAAEKKSKPKPVVKPKVKPAVKPVVKPDINKAELSSRFKPVSLTPSKPPVKKKVKKTPDAGFQKEELKELPPEKGFFKKVFSGLNHKKQKSKPAPKKKPEPRKKEMQSMLGEDSTDQ
jgi:hypothetical protein